MFKEVLLFFKKALTNLVPTPRCLCRRELILLGGVQTGTDPISNYENDIKSHFPSICQSLYAEQLFKNRPN